MTDISLTLELGGRELLGDVHVTLQAFVGKPGQPSAAERTLANDVGLRLGPLSETWELVLDGQGSLFPIVHVMHTPADPLWRLVVEDWEDATFDEFSAEFISLEVNEAHPAFSELLGDPQAPYATNLFKQVIASWLVLFFEAVKERTREQEVDPAAGDEVTQWEAISNSSGRHRALLLPGSIAKAASEFVSRGDLDLSSSGALLYSAQEWIDRRFAGG